jgi:hypothetical protein
MSGYYGSRSRNTSRHQQDRSQERSDPFHFGDDFMGGIGGDFFGDSSRGRNPGYRTEEQRPQDFSYARSSPRREREENSYATENVYSGRFGSAARPSTGRRQRAGSSGSSSRSISPPTMKNYGGRTAYRAQSPGYVPQGRSAYSQARPRSPSPVYNTRRYSPSPPRSDERFGRSSGREPPPAHYQQTYREASPPRAARPGTSGNTYGARDNSSRYGEPEPRTYRAYSPPPQPKSQQRSSSNRPGSRRQPAHEHESPKKDKHWYSGFAKGMKDEFSSSKRSSSRRPESRHRQPAEDQQRQPRDSSRQRGYAEQSSSGFHQRSSSSRPQDRRPETSSKTGAFDGWKQSQRQRSPSPEARRPQTSRQEQSRGYTTEEHRPGGWSNTNSKPSGGHYSSQQRSHSPTDHEDHAHHSERERRRAEYDAEEPRPE